MLKNPKTQNYSSSAREIEEESLTEIEVCFVVFGTALVILDALFAIH